MGNADLPVPRKDRRAGKGTPPKSAAKFKPSTSVFQHCGVYLQTSLLLGVSVANSALTWLLT